VSTRSWRRRSAAFALPVVLASGCLLVAPPEDLPALGASGSGAQGGGGSAGSSIFEMGGSGASMTVGGGAGSETNPEGGGPESGGNAGAAGSGETGANGGGGVGGSAGAGAKGGKGGSEAMGGAGEGGAPGCTTNKACGDYWAGPARCRQEDHTCVQLISNECTLVEGPSDDPNALFIGSFVVYGDNPKKSDVYAAEKLAVDEINAAGGLPAADGSGRPLVLVACMNDTADAIPLGMTHLVEDVQVPAILAMLLADDLGDAFEQAKNANKQLFFLNPGATVSTLADPTYAHGLIWTLLGQSGDYAPAYGLLLSALEQQVRLERGLMPSDQLKVALVSTTDTASKDLHFFLFRGLEFNGGASASANGTAGNYQEFLLDPANSPSQSVIDALVAFEPDVVISAASLSPEADVMTGPLGVLPRLEGAWNSSKPRPFYLLSPYNGTTDAQNIVTSVVMSEVGDPANPEPTAARRFLGVNAAPPQDTTLENAFEVRYGKAFPDLKSTAPNVDNYYDAVYFLAYAMYGGDSLTGPGIVNGMKRLIKGAPFNDGSDDMAISKVFTALAGNDSISLNSTLGPPDFEPTTGVRPITPGVFCFTYNGSVTFRPNELRYDPTNNVFTGTYRCLDNFPPP
jgi:hypothetical protein